MVRKTKLSILFFVAIALIITMIFHRQEQQDILMEMFVFPNISSGNIGEEVYHFILKSNGDLKSSNGIGFFGIFAQEDVRMLTFRRMTSTLSTQEIQYISSLLARIEGNNDASLWVIRSGWQRVIISYNENIFNNSTACWESWEALQKEIWRLSPLTTQS
jgi:hypothetical protein